VFGNRKEKPLGKKEEKSSIRITFYYIIRNNAI